MGECLIGEPRGPCNPPRPTLVQWNGRGRLGAERGNEKVLVGSAGKMGVRPVADYSDIQCAIALAGQNAGTVSHSVS